LGITRSRLYLLSLIFAAVTASGGTALTGQPPEPHAGADRPGIASSGVRCTPGPDLPGLQPSCTDSPLPSGWSAPRKRPDPAGTGTRRASSRRSRSPHSLSRQDQLAFLLGEFCL